LVLDTNLVLDWLVFDDVVMRELSDHARESRVVVLTYDTAIDELIRVLAYAQLKLDVANQKRVVAEYRSLSRPAVMPEDFSLSNLRLPLGFPQCRDPDDQYFLAIAWHAKADALATRDKALLKLGAKAKRFGVNVFDVARLRSALSSR
jgi:putative PIN family toxin of toxin-antitoxin system